jgi:hypothetical protein
LFQHIRIYVNAINDITVPYVTAAIELEDPFAEYETNGIEVELQENYNPLVKSYALPPVPPTRTPKPTVLSRSWFRDRKRKFPLPPLLRKVRFPFNLVVYALLPILIPVAISSLIIYLPFGSRASKSRIKLLESDGSDHPRLIDILTKLEREVEDAVVDLIDDPEPVERKSKPSSQPFILKPIQRKIVASLNQLPIKKELAFIDDVLNSHAVIVCRDVKRFEGHRRGEGVVRHWAENFIF